MQLIKKHILLIILAIVQGVSFAQSDTTDIDSTKKKLEPIKINIFYSYYEQDGVHSPVTGGIGDEELNDNVFKLKAFIPLGEKVDFNFMGGIDLYTSASTDNINNEYDFYTETSASYADSRKYGSIGISIKQEGSKTAESIGLGYSSEWDVESINGNFSFSKESKDANTALQIKGTYFRDNWELIYPLEMRTDTTPNGGDYLSENIRHLLNFSVTIKRNLTRRFNAMISAEVIYQNGLLSTPFHRVYFADSIAHDIERLPSEKIKIPVSIFANYYLSDRFITKFRYRFYWDSFDMQAHTAEVLIPIKVAQFLRVTPFYRWHIQSSAKYFSPFAQSNESDLYYTADYDLSAFVSHKYGLALKYSPLYGIFKRGKKPNLKHEFIFKSIDFRFAKYSRFNSSGVIFKSFIASAGFTFLIK